MGTVGSSLLPCPRSTPSGDRGAGRPATAARHPVTSPTTRPVGLWYFSRNTASPSYFGHGWFLVQGGSVATPDIKPHTSLTKQVDLRSSRNLHIPDRAIAECWLRNVGHYRLSGYWYPYRAKGPGSPRLHDHVVDGTTFDDVIGLYELVCRLTLLVLEAIERVEIAIRSQVGHVLGRRHPHAHLSQVALDG
ncbi:MAG: Abi family protein [Phycicoccus sp.]